MYRIIDGRSTGKTSRLLLLAKENNGIVVCAYPEWMKEKAYKYGLVGIDFISYDYQTVKGDYVTEYEAKFRALNMPIHRIVATVNKDNLKPWNEAMK